jgi:hypothetical protein
MPAQSGVASANLMGPSEGRRERSGTVHTSGTQAHEAATGNALGSAAPEAGRVSDEVYQHFSGPAATAAAAAALARRANHGTGIGSRFLRGSPCSGLRNDAVPAAGGALCVSMACATGHLRHPRLHRASWSVFRQVGSKTRPSRNRTSRRDHVPTERRSNETMSQRDLVAVCRCENAVDRRPEEHFPVPINRKML